jgi:hypothetical protein
MGIFEEIMLKREEDAVIRSLKTSKEYLHWWNIQKATLAAFIIFLAASIIWSWWLLIFSFTFLGINLFANVKRLMILRRR